MGVRCIILSTLVISLYSDIRVSVLVVALVSPRNSLELCRIISASQNHRSSERGLRGYLTHPHYIDEELRLREKKQVGQYHKSGQ